MPPDKYTLDRLLGAMKEAALKGGDIMLNHDLDSLDIKEKSSPRDIVTKYDTEIQCLIISLLKEHFPGAGFIAEEQDIENCTDSAPVFAIDPIDGTTNFAKGYNHSCISIACIYDCAPVAGVVYCPYTSEMFYAASGCGAYLNNRQIHVSDLPLRQSLVHFGTSPYNTELLDVTFEMVRSVFTKCLDVRRSGSAALDICYVAGGRAGLYFEAILSLWDYAAGAVILTEAGGEICTLDGEPLPFAAGKTSVIAGTKNTINQSELLKTVI